MPERKLCGTWQIMRNLGTSKKMIQLPIEEAPLQFNDPAEVHVYNERIDRIEARGLGFSELQSNSRACTF